MLTIGLFEDEVVDHLAPLASTRATFDLRPGALTLKERAEAVFGSRARLWCREELAGMVARSHPDHAINAPYEEGIVLINGRWFAEPGDLVDEITAVATSGEVPTAWIVDDIMVAAWSPKGSSVVDHGADDPIGFVQREAGAVILINRLGQLVEDPGSFITADAEILAVTGRTDSQTRDLIANTAVLINRGQIVIEEGARIGPLAVIDAAGGHVIIERDAVIGAGAILTGPCHIGEKAQVKAAARISRSSIGYNSRAGGEISKSVLHAHSNKAHDGYLGNSYVGEWCNLGADTNTSNLRNDYGEVTLFDRVTGKYEPTGLQFAGLIMGDHSVCGINTMFNTGTVIGVCCNVFGAGYQKRNIKDFSWGSPVKMLPHKFEKAMAAAEAMMRRRDQSLSDVEENVLRELSRISH